MAKKELAVRDNWQTKSGVKASNAEKNLYKAFKKHLKGTEYILHEKPKHLKNLYAQVQLPDFAIENIRTGKIPFGEIKRQDGWVEGKDPSAGRGNAHERLCKLFTPGLLKAYREISQIHSTNILPFWVVFLGDITRDPKRNREIAFWFDEYNKNFFMWRPNMTDKDLTDHFDKYLKQYLEV